jgi:putative colanic acid biosynthesis acetyltransferase WcaF
MNDSTRIRLKNPNQTRRGSSPWSRRERLAILAWKIVEGSVWRYSPKPLNRWRLLLLRTFGARIQGYPYVDPTASIRIPWQSTIESGAAVGERVEIYNLGHVRLGACCVLGPGAYLCGGSHDLNSPLLPLTVGDIDVGREVFIGAKAILLPGVVIADGAVIGAGAVVTKDMPAWTICAGNPCRAIKPRVHSAWIAPTKDPSLGVE